MQWCIIDLHIHTPASRDYQQPGTSYLDILQRAEARGLDILAITDHNTVAGYRTLEEEIEQLVLLEKLNRLRDDEKKKLQEYRRLRQKILVLPGFEFTATFGFHILAIFSPDKSTREIEHLLLDLRIPGDQLDAGSATVGATSDVLTAYRLIREAGGLVIAAHANSSNGVAMRGFPMGGQTKIAYTQDSNLYALEVTDLDQKGRYSTATFFNGSKPEYPRRMHCIQGSDAHRLTLDPQRKKNLGIGERTTEVLLPEVSFESLLDVFAGNDFARTQPHLHKEDTAIDIIQCAQEDGANIIQDFHESMEIKGGKLYAIVADICAFANTNGGTLFIGVSPDPKKGMPGVPDPEQGIVILEKEVANRIDPPLTCVFDVMESQGVKVIRGLVPRGDDPPYAVDDSKIYVRSEAETGMAVRDEIVSLVKRNLAQKAEAPAQSQIASPKVPAAEPEAIFESNDTPPRTGVEIVSVIDRGGLKVYTVRDLRNGNMVRNVTQASARRLWQYAISTHSRLTAEPSKVNITWLGSLGLYQRHKQGNVWRYDLVQRTTQGNRWYFGVTDDGIHGLWRKLVGLEEE